MVYYIWRGYIRNPCCTLTSASLKWDGTAVSKFIITYTMFKQTVCYALGVAAFQTRVFINLMALFGRWK